MMALAEAQSATMMMMMIVNIALLGGEVDICNVHRHSTYFLAAAADFQNALTSWTNV